MKLGNKTGLQKFHGFVKYCKTSFFGSGFINSVFCNRVDSGPSIPCYWNSVCQKIVLVPLLCCPRKTVELELSIYSNYNTVYFHSYNPALWRIIFSCSICYCFFSMHYEVSCFALSSYVPCNPRPVKQQNSKFLLDLLMARVMNEVIINIFLVPTPA